MMSELSQMSKSSQISKKKTIIIAAVVAVILILLFIWFEIPRIGVRKYIKANLPEGSYKLYLNNGDFITYDETYGQVLDRIWHVYDRDRNIHFNVVWTNKSISLGRHDEHRSDEVYYHDTYDTMFVAKFGASVIADTNLTWKYDPNDKPQNFEVYSRYHLTGYYETRTELDALYEELEKAATKYDEKNVPRHLGFYCMVFKSPYVDPLRAENYIELRTVGDLERKDLDEKINERYDAMIAVGLEYEDEGILSQFTQEEIDDYKARKAAL